MKALQFSDSSVEDQEGEHSSSRSTQPPSAQGSVLIQARKGQGDFSVTVGARLTGCVVVDVNRDGPAASAGVESGWVLVEINGRRVTSTQDITSTFNVSPPLLRAAFIEPIRDDPTAPRKCPYCGEPCGAKDSRDWARHVASCCLAQTSPPRHADHGGGGRKRGMLQGLEPVFAGRTQGAVAGSEALIGPLMAVGERLMTQLGLSSKTTASSSESSEEETMRRRRKGRPKRGGNGALSFGSGMSEKPLRLLKRLFSAKLSGTFGGAGLPAATFTEHFAPLLCPDPRVQDRDEATRLRVLREFTTKIDTDANGVVDWEEFSSFLLTRTREGLQDHHEFTGTLYTLHPASADRLIPAPGSVAAAVPHKANAHRIVAPRPSQNLDKYFTASPDGTVKVWSAQKIAYERTIHNDTTNEQSGLIVDIACLPISNRLLVTQVDRTLTLYDAMSGALHKVYRGWMTKRWSPGTHPIAQTKAFLEEQQTKEQRKREMLSIDECGTKQHRDLSHLSADMRLMPMTRPVSVLPIEGMDNAPFCCEALSPELQRSLFPNLSEPVLFGMDQGYVHLYDLRPATGTDGLRGLLRGHCWKPHEHWVTRAVACEKMDALITSSTDEFLKVTDLEKGEAIKSLGGPGVLCSAVTLDGRARESAIYGFDYCAGDYDVIATYGASRSVQFWRPTMQSPVEKLELKAPVVAVKFSPSMGQCVVLTRDKFITVYDLRTFRALDQIEDKHTRSPDNYLSALEIDERRRCILTAANMPIVFCSGHPGESEDSPVQSPVASPARPGSPKGKRQKESSPPSSPRSGAGAGAGKAGQTAEHKEPVVAVLHNARFGHLVTVDSKRVFVWDTTTGDIVSKWCPGEQVMQGGMAAAAFDTGRRRMATGGQQGQVAFWNYVTGEQLKEVRNPHTFALTCVAHTDVSGPGVELSVLVACGWSSRVLFFVDQPGEFFVPLHRDARLQEDMGHVYSLTASGNRIAMGMQRGQCLVYDVASMLLLAVLPAVLDGPALSPTVRRGSKRQSVGGVSVATSRRLSRRGIEFAEAYAEIQQGLSGIVEQVHMLSTTAAVTLSGCGLVCVWKLGLKGASEVSAAFRGSWREGEEAFALCIPVVESERGGRNGDDGTGRLWIGDAGGVVTLFDA
eukprot:Hpha_TRINITY_DN2848_c0_g1::TRINITY_DN2848_c0_g1_i1::g.171407::m.171407